MNKSKTRGLLFVFAFGILCASHSAELPVIQKNERLKQLNATEKALSDTLQEKNPAAKHNMTISALTYLGTAQSFAGDSYGALLSFERQNKIYEDDERAERKARNDANAGSAIDAISDQIRAEIQKAHATNALEAIVSEAKGRQIVILNEAHHVPMHRAFARMLARRLRQEGYEYLACEAFNGVDLAPLSQSYVAEQDGIYTKEPMFANFLNDAIKDKWKFVSYEVPMGQPREIGMAKNLIDRILKKDPQAKIFIYVGYNHVNKSPEAKTDGDNSRMAAQLKRLTGIDPLTIDQTTLFQQYDTKKQFELYTAALKKKTTTQPFVLKSPQNTYVKLGIDQARVDIQVTYPKYEIDRKTGRMSWLSSLAGFTPQDIPKNLLPSSGRRLIYARYRDAPLDAVPVDVVMVTAGRPVPKLMLPEGQFRFSIED